MEHLFFIPTRGSWNKSSTLSSSKFNLFVCVRSRCMWWWYLVWKTVIIACSKFKVEFEKDIRYRLFLYLELHLLFCSTWCRINHFHLQNWYYLFCWFWFIITIRFGFMELRSRSNFFICLILHQIVFWCCLYWIFCGTWMIVDVYYVNLRYFH